jgi:hypothetical protein
LAAELEASLREFTAAWARGVVREGRAPGALIGTFLGSSRVGRETSAAHLVRTYNLTRRVIAITDHSEARLVLAVERFGRSRPDRLEFVRTEFERSARKLVRGILRGAKNLLAREFPDETLESLGLSMCLRLFFGNRNSASATAGVLVGSGAAIPSDDGSFARMPGAADRSCASELDGKLEERHPRCGAAINI